MRMVLDTLVCEIFAFSGMFFAFVFVQVEEDYHLWHFYGTFEVGLGHCTCSVRIFSVLFDSSFLFLYASNCLSFMFVVEPGPDSTTERE